MSLDGYIAQQFAAHGVPFFHAENLRNFQTYCQARAVLCREELKLRDGSGFTEFYSDETDDNLGVLGRVFGNVYDFGGVFSRGRKAIPNVYGPIMLAFRPQSFSRMSEILITPQSIATLQADWRRNVVSSREQIQHLLQGDDYGDPIHKSWYFCELSCANRELSFDDLEYVEVEPLTVLGRRLSDVVKATLASHRIQVPVMERAYRNRDNHNALQHLVSLCEQLNPPHHQHRWQFRPSQWPPVFAALPQKLQNRLALWCRYFTYGTVLPLRQQGPRHMSLASRSW